LKKSLNTISVAMIVISIITLLGGCAGEPDVKVSEKENRGLIHRYFEEMNRRNKTYLDEYLGPNYIYHGPNGDLDVEGFKTMHSMFLTAFPDAHAVPEDIISEGDKVVTRWKIQGTHKGEFQGIAPTGKRIIVTGIIISRIEEGKAVEEWEEIDQLGMLQQLGIIPSPGSKDE
jgi:predicted ester cyclase